MSRRSSEALAGKRRKNGLAPHTGSWVGFVDLPLTSEQKERLASLEEVDYPDLFGFLTEVLEDGYKLSLVTDHKHHCTIATLTGKGETCLNAGYSLSGRGPDMMRALLTLHFKHVVLCEGLRWAEHAETNTSQLSMWG